MQTKNKILVILAALALSATAILWAKESAGTETVPTAPETPKANPCVKVIEATSSTPAEWDCTEDIETSKAWAAYERTKLEAEKAQLQKELDKAKSRTRKVSVTGYSSRAQETDDTPCISADNSDICKLYAKGENICATNDFPMHTVLHIEGLGSCTVRDRMNRRYTGTNRVDWYYGHDTKKAISHGVRMAMATIKE